MKEPPKIAVIVNPAAHKGGADKRWPAIQTELVRRRLDMLFGVMPKLYSGAHVYPRCGQATARHFASCRRSRPWSISMARQ
jgi:hypothetical protein